MRREIVWYYLLPIACFSGCAMMSPAQHASTAELDALSIQQFSHRMDFEGKRAPIDFNQFQPGGFCKVESISDGGRAGDSNALRNNPQPVSRNQSRVVAGRIVAIDDDQIVLADAISISANAGPATGMPISTKMLMYATYGPFASRMFKNSGVGHRTIPIPGEVKIDRASVRELQPVDGTNWDYVQQSGQWFERIGIDFDFNVDRTSSWSVQGVDTEGRASI